LKTLSYIDNILAAREARSMNVDDALMLNSAGRVACSTIGNLFIVKDECLFTPAEGEAILPGIMRAVVLTVAKRLGIYAKPKRLRPTDLVQADSIFITNSLRFIRPVTKLDGRRYVRKSPIIARLSEALLRLERDQLMLEQGVIS
jgi:branched-chain amino acid aminotransferase